MSKEGHNNMEKLNPEQQQLVDFFNSEDFDWEESYFLYLDELNISADAAEKMEEPGMYMLDVETPDYILSGAPAGKRVEINGHTFVCDTNCEWHCVSGLEMCKTISDLLDAEIGYDGMADEPFDDMLEYTLKTVLTPQEVMQYLPDVTYYEYKGNLFYYVKPEELEDFADIGEEDLEECYLLADGAKEISKERATELFINGSYEIEDPM